MHSVFITGIPTAGKSFLADKLCTSLGMRHVKLDDLWDSVQHDPLLEPWYNYFWHKDEAEYYRTSSPEKLWQDIVDQSEAIWPTAKKHIEEILSEGKPAIFEGVGLLPHLMQQLPLKGVVLVAASEDQILERLKQKPRWSDKEELQRVEAYMFFTVERPNYLAQAEKYGYPSFSDPDAAEAELQVLTHGILSRALCTPREASTNRSF